MSNISSTSQTTSTSGANDTTSAPPLPPPGTNAHTSSTGGVAGTSSTAATGATGATAATGSTPGAASTLIMEGTDTTGGLTTTSLLTTAATLPQLIQPEEMSIEDYQEGNNNVANFIEGKDSSSCDSESTTSVNSNDSTSSGTTVTDTTESDTSTSSVDDDTTDTTDTTDSTSSTTSTTSTSDSSTGTDELTFTDIMNDLAGLDVSISNTLDTQNTAIMNQLAGITSTGYAEADDVKQAAQDSFDGALAGLCVSASLSAVSLAGTAGATKGANEAQDSASQTDTETSINQTTQAQKATEEAVSNPNDTAATSSARAQIRAARTANAKPGVPKEIQESNNASLDAQEAALNHAQYAPGGLKATQAGSISSYAPIPKVDPTTGEALTEPDSRPDATPGAIIPVTHSSSEVAGQQAQESLQASKLALTKSETLNSSNTADAKAAIAATSKAVAASTKASQSGNADDIKNAQQAHAEARTANAKPGVPQSLRDQNEATLKSSEQVYGGVKGTKLSSDASTHLNAAQISHAATIKNNTVTKPRFGATAEWSAVFNQQNAKFAVLTSMSGSMSQMAEQGSNLAAAQEQANQKEQEATQQVYNEGLSTSNQTDQALLQTAESLRQSSAQVAGDMQSTAGMVRGSS